MTTSNITYTRTCWPVWSRLNEYNHAWRENDAMTYSEPLHCNSAWPSEVKTAVTSTVSDSPWSFPKRVSALSGPRICEEMFQSWTPRNVIPYLGQSNADCLGRKPRYGEILHVISALMAGLVPTTTTRDNVVCHSTCSWQDCHQLSAYQCVIQISSVDSEVVIM